MLKSTETFTRSILTIDIKKLYCARSYSQDHYNCFNLINITNRDMSNGNL